MRATILPYYPTIVMFMQLSCIILHIDIDKIGVLQQEYSQPSILPSSHFQCAVSLIYFLLPWGL